ncbi:MAG TPA: TfuA-like protein [Acidobacteriaceae bacterium]|nr:TfuA-like protein [Acidobacteriaceae bacterium]
MRDTAIFLGPTLARADAERILDADYLPPICRGDLARLPSHIRFVGIIDGEFFQSLSVSPKEVVALLRRGVTVCGASSMGALRAAETYQLGTIGVGCIFEMFRDGILDADDEVALVYQRDTFRKLSDPLVNLRAALSLAASAGIITAAEQHTLTLRLKSLYFPDRSFNALYALCPRLRDFFTHTPPPDPKRDDALQLLHTLHHLRSLNPAHPTAPQIEQLTPLSG